VLEPAEFRITRIVGEQRTRAREHIFRRVAASVPNGLVGTLEDLLMVKPDENSSGLQAIKANPSKPSVCDAHFTRQTEGSVNNFAIVDTSSDASRPIKAFTRLR
jgi:hypothetical protein